MVGNPEKCQKRDWKNIVGVIPTYNLMATTYWVGRETNQMVFLDYTVCILHAWLKGKHGILEAYYTE